MAQKYDFYYERFFAVNRDLFCVMSETGYFLQVNESWEKILGYSNEEMLSQPFYYFMHPDDIASTVEVASKSAEGTESRPTFINRYRAKDGTYCYLDWCGYVEEGLFYGFARDISVLKNQENELRRTQKRMEAIIDSQTNYVFRCDLAENYTYVNSKYLANFAWAYPSADLTGQPIAKSISSRTQSVMSETIHQAIQAAGKVFQVEIEKPLADGTLAFSLWDIVCIVDEDGKPSELQCVGIDISERKQREQEQQIQQQNAILDMSTPITLLWDGILLLPLVGIMNAQRAQNILSMVLSKISDTQAKVFILDIGGVAVVDTEVANYFIKLSKATRLMGCQCTMSGISPAVAQTIIELGIQIEEINTTGTMKDALEKALQLTGMHLVSFVKK